VETFSIIGGLLCFSTVVTAWLLIAKARKLSARTIFVGLAIIALPFALGAVTTIAYLVVDEPLMSAAYQGDLAGLKWSLNAGANPNLVDEFNMTPLCAALANDKVDAAKLLIERGANPNTPCEVQSLPTQNPLDIAAQRREWDFVAFLKAHKAVRYRKN
jgi:hypothetical protein